MKYNKVILNNRPYKLTNPFKRFASGFLSFPKECFQERWRMVQFFLETYFPRIHIPLVRSLSFSRLSERNVVSNLRHRTWLVLNVSQKMWSVQEKIMNNPVKIVLAFFSFQNKCVCVRLRGLLQSSQVASKTGLTTFK